MRLMIAILCLLFVSTAFAQDGVEPSHGSGFSLFNSRVAEPITLALEDTHKSLVERGIDCRWSTTFIFQQNARGGLQTHASQRITSSSDYELTLDLEVMDLWHGGKIYVAGESSWRNGQGRDFLGSIASVNGDDVDNNSLFIRELWYEHIFWDGRARLKVGKVDIGADVDANAYANDETSQFLNCSLINTANIPAPDYGLTAILVVQPADQFYASVGIADAQANARGTGFDTAFHDEDYLLYGMEFGFMPVWATNGGKLPGAYRLGVWYDPLPKEVFFDDLDGRRRTVPLKRDDLGFYFNMDQMLFKEHPQDDSDAQGLGMFLRYGFADEDANSIEHFWSVGAQYQGLIPSRDDDVIAFGFSQMLMSDKLRSIDGTDRESVYELYYNVAVLPWLSISPDVQYIDNPGGHGGRDSVVASLRIQMSF